MKSWLFLIMLALSTAGCLNDEKIIAHYRFKDAKVSRIDVDKKSYFYYGNCNSKEKIVKEASVVIDWQFDDFLQSSLIFHKDGTVEIMNDGGGQFSAVKRNDSIFFKEYESPEYSIIKQKYLPPNRFHNFCRLSDNLKFEAKTNKEFGSDVSMDYILEREGKKMN